MTRAVNANESLLQVGITLLLCLCWGVPGRAQRAEPPAHARESLRTEPKLPFTLHDRFLDYLNSSYGPRAPLGPAAGAAWGQMWNTPREWKRGWAGYGRRFGSNEARNVIGNTIRFGVGALDQEDPRHYPSHQARIWPRARDAIIETFMPHTISGGRRFAFSTLAGNYGAAFISNAWYPAHQANIQYALWRGSTATAWSIGGNVFREFWPDLRKLLRR